MHAVYVVVLSSQFFTMAAPLFGKKWYEKPKAQHKEAMEQFRGAVASARTGSDEGVRQVKNVLFFRSRSGLVVVAG